MKKPPKIAYNITAKMYIKEVYFIAGNYRLIHTNDRDKTLLIYGNKDINLKRIKNILGDNYRLLNLDEQIEQIQPKINTSEQLKLWQ